MSATQRKRITPNHEAIVDWEILHPGGTMKECAVEIDMAEVSISIIRNSDIFKDYRNRRLAEHHANISDSVIQKAEGVACVALDVLQERIAKERDSIGLTVVSDIADKAMRALGFGGGNGRTNGAGAGQGSNGVTVIIGATPEMLASAREKMKTITPQAESAPEQPELLPLSLPPALPPLIEEQEDATTIAAVATALQDAGSAVAIATPAP